MSDWERRPLSSRQLTYAALDAYVLLQIVEAITHEEPAITSQQLQQFTFTYDGHRPQSRNLAREHENQSQPQVQSQADSTDMPHSTATAVQSNSSCGPAAPALLLSPSSEPAMHERPAEREHAWSGGASHLQCSLESCRQRTQASPAVSIARRHSLTPCDASQRGRPPGAHCTANAVLHVDMQSNLAVCQTRFLAAQSYLQLYVCMCSVSS